MSTLILSLPTPGAALIGTLRAVGANATDTALPANAADFFVAALEAVLDNVAEDAQPQQAATPAQQAVPANTHKRDDDSAALEREPEPADVLPSIPPSMQQPVAVMPVATASTTPAVPVATEASLPDAALSVADAIAAPQTKTTLTAPIVKPVAADNAQSTASTSVAPVRDALIALAPADVGSNATPDALVRLPNGEPTQWRQPLQQALGERLQLSSSRHSDSAVIRLDPPQMGRIEIAIRHEAGALRVSLTATHAEVVRQLQGVGESLRHDLSQRHAGEVSVQVADAAGARLAQGDADGRQRQRGSQGEGNDAAPTRAFADDEYDERHAFGMSPEEERSA
ncbi:flagellar hook-length control protein FliK [Uliginosibacterium sp. sgz301328]|uniref:flagellar hook-length control protein FliK n=1 Tax=Uliginosibacterium sp. sgz301328 TaxID=3243764 RepID=UPI00359E66B9